MGCGASSNASAIPAANGKTLLENPVDETLKPVPSVAVAPGSHSPRLVELLGENLKSKSGQVKTSEALGGKGAIALYFSAHWCPPCRGFTPKFAEWYKKNLKAKGLEVVFISSDKDEAAFEKYYGEQPWLALPYSDRDRKNSLSKKFKVQGIPSVVILDGEGNLINKEGRGAVSSDPKGEKFPWKPKTIGELLAEATLIAPNGETQKFENLTGAATALYFSAHWCPPCRGFTPKLAEWYKNDLQAKGLDVVFVSSDRDESSFKEYFADQPWHALEYSQRQVKEELSEALGINGIPSLVIIDKDFSVINKDGRAAVSNDPKGESFPWHPKPVHSFTQGPGRVNEMPMVIAFCETSSPETQRAIEMAMASQGSKFLAEATARKEEDPEITFAICTEADGLATKLRGAVNLLKESQTPCLAILDIPDDGGCYQGPAGDITEDVVAKFVADYMAKRLQRRQMQR